VTEPSGNNEANADPQTPGRASGPAVAFVPARSGALGGARPSAREAGQAERNIRTGFDEEVDARERAERDPRKYREPDYVNEAVGAATYRVNYGESAWKLEDGREFMVTRYYQHKRIVVDYCRNPKEELLVPRKRAVMRKLGIAYIALPCGASLTLSEMRKAIDNERKAIAEANQPAPAAKAPEAPAEAKAEDQAPDQVAAQADSQGNDQPAPAAAPVSGQGPSAPEARRGNKGGTRHGS